MDEAERRSGGLSPFKVFLALATLLLAGFATYFLTRDTTPDPQRTSHPQEQSIPTQAEAAAEIDQLTGLRFEAYETQNLELLDQFLTSNSPLRDIIAGEIDDLEANDLTMSVTWQTVSVTSLRGTVDRAIVRHVIQQRLDIANAEGKQVGTRKETVRTVRWVLHLEDGEWRLHNSKLLKDTPA